MSSSTSFACKKLCPKETLLQAKREVEVTLGRLADADARINESFQSLYKHPQLSKKVIIGGRAWMYVNFFFKGTALHIRFT